MTTPHLLCSKVRHMVQSKVMLDPMSADLMLSKPLDCGVDQGSASWKGKSKSGISTRHILFLLNLYLVIVNAHAVVKIKTEIPCTLLPSFSQWYISKTIIVSQPGYEHEYNVLICVCVRTHVLSSIQFLLCRYLPPQSTYRIVPSPQGFLCWPFITTLASPFSHS